MQSDNENHYQMPKFITYLIDGAAVKVTQDVIAFVAFNRTLKKLIIARYHFSV